MRFAEICEQLRADLPGFSARVTDAIRAELASYAAVPYEEQHGYIRDELALLLDAMQHGTPLGVEQAARTRALGRRRALQGIPLHDVIETFHIAGREAWVSFTGAQPDQELVRGGGRLWEFVHRETTELAAGHTEATRDAAVVRAAQNYRALDLLVRFESSRLEETAEALRHFGIRLDASVVGIAVVLDPADGSAAATLERTARAVADDRAGWPVGRYRRWLLVLCPAADGAGVAEALGAAAPGGAVGLGAARVGIPGAAASLQDAIRLLEIEGDGGVRRFEDHWWLATLLPHERELAGLLEPGRRVAAANPHLAETVKAYAAQGLSLTAAARAQQLHVNSVTYRLDRWRELTGWDVRTLDGLLRSVAALGLPS
ncbi:PucR family transcriptional regulator [Calidifontibacter sp. DB0510]|uniref:PucR family transcriptional regulator n=1 Tax=Metallococcus carri TaxID=1656884 RepID=A0A967E849_9MICO|nr:helix-turn-helix domain-containing protein [Metallococcus carri]NHN54842.1 PucR family transcriptional regulator [Metallococcus carri]NOP37187.1 helix-turn-helix domain-containing protein [Calidifontibacter sp. DB2511S]